MMRKIVWRDYLGITLGALITAISLNMFLIPNKIAAGGVSGLATVLYYLLNWPVGVIMLAFNVPLFIIGLKVLGARYGINTLFGAAMLSIMIDLTAPFTPVLTSDLLLNSLYGGVVGGIGMGLVFRSKGNTAGTALAAVILNKILGIRIGQAMMAADFFVIVFAGLAFKSAELSLYALISMFVTGQIVDLVQEGPSTSKAFFVMSNQPKQVAAAIINEMDRGVTVLQARGGYTGESRETLLCVVSTSEVTQLKEVIYQIDPKAFVIVTTAHEVLGEGFTEVNKG
ncbi:YitT family protein [Pelosinus sp. IPA-1]|uniref:YitT family protein n=1 Tax=Pelosinus sp. IPA-1 TaxID=3029569 RepID=UPI0025540AEA|nr:YitT family protein [Pelosinus sp. IPA-1]